jgi:3-oxoacyl-[acyl-carrier-protein] synthase-1
MKSKHKVYLNAFSCACAAGLTIEEIFDTLVSGKTAITYQENYVEGRSMPLGKIPSERDFFELLSENIASLLTKTPWLVPAETIVLVGSSVGGMCRAEKEFFNEGSLEGVTVEEISICSVADTACKNFGFKSALSFTTACTSSSIAIDFAYDLISHELYKTVLVIGADELSRSAVNGFDRLGIASHAHTRPFDVERNGINVAEGIAVLALSSLKTPQCVEIMGCGVSSDAYNITHPHPEGEGAMAAMNQALEKANLEAFKIDYINAHGTGTIANDEIESASIEKLFGSKPFTVSTKAVTGHTLGACGALEAAISAMSILNNLIPPCTNLVSPVNSVLNHPLVAISTEVNYVLSNAFGFGGGNAVIVLGKVHAN